MPGRADPVSGNSPAAACALRSAQPCHYSAVSYTHLDVYKRQLTDREQLVLRLRFGLDDGRARTLEEVGRDFNVTRERIRQIEAKALRKLRHPSRSKKLKDFLD